MDEPIEVIRKLQNALVDVYGEAKLEALDLGPAIVEFRLLNVDYWICLHTLSVMVYDRGIMSHSINSEAIEHAIKYGTN